MTERKPWQDKFETIEEEDEGKGTSSPADGLTVPKQDSSKRRSIFGERHTHTLEERRIETLSNDTLAPPTYEDEIKLSKPESNFEIEFHNSSEESRPLTSPRRMDDDKASPLLSSSSAQPSSLDIIAEKRT